MIIGILIASLMVIIHGMVEAGNVCLSYGNCHCRQPPPVFGLSKPSFCEDLNECLSGPCQNGGTCNNCRNMYTCTCAPGWTGTDCDTETLECSSSPCLNGAQCFEGANAYTCICVPEFTGVNCEMKRTCPNVTMETVFGQARLPMTDFGIVIDSEELCPEEDSEGPAAPITRAVCQVSSNGTTYWNASIRCQYDITRQLDRILMNGVYDVNVAEEVFTITKNYEDITAIDIVTGLIVGIVNNVMFVDEDVLASAQENGNYTTLIIQVLESQLNTVVVGNSVLDAAYPKIAVQVLDVPLDTARDGIVITLLSMDNGSLSNSDIMVETHQDTPSDSVPRDTFARVVVPIEVAQVFTTPEVTEGPSSFNNNTSGDNLGTTTASGVSSGPGETTGKSAIGSLRVAFVVYANDAMFPSPSLALLNREINTPVVSLTVGGQKIENLMERANITLYRFKPDSRDPTCNFWEFNLGKWSMEGCQLLPDNTANSSNDEYYTCACDHLTNFAVLVDIYAEEEPPKPALRILSIIGCAISCVCLVIAIMSYLSVKKIRRSQTHKIFIFLCTTLLCLYTVSLAIIALDTEFQQAEIELIPCSVLAALVHYFVLSSLTWMGIEGFNTYLVIVKVFNTYIPKFMIKASIVGWGIPAVIVAATGAITRNYYAEEDYCYIRKWPLIGGLLVPMAIILIVNIAVFIVAMRRLQSSARMAGRVKKDYKIERQETLERIHNGIAMLLLLGFTWTTGYLTLINVDYTKFLFIIFNSLQGFFIFVLYCLRKETIRKQWRRCICCALLREGGGAESKGNSGRTPGSTSGTKGSQPMFESSSAISHTNPSFEYAN